MVTYEFYVSFGTRGEWELIENPDRWLVQFNWHSVNEIRLLLGMDNLPVYYKRRAVVSSRSSQQFQEIIKEDFKLPPPVGPRYYTTSGFPAYFVKEEK